MPADTPELVPIGCCSSDAHLDFKELPFLPSHTSLYLLCLELHCDFIIRFLCQEVLSVPECRAGGRVDSTFMPIPKLEQEVLRSLPS